MTQLLVCRCGPRRFIADAGRRSAKSDPTGTSPLQRKWNKELTRRWTSIKRLVPDMLSKLADPVGMVAHTAATGDDRVRAFGKWLDEAMNQIVLARTGAWMLPYVRAAADTGLQHARSSAEALQPSQSTTTAGDRTPIVQSLVIEELQGIMDAVSQQLTRVFAQGLLFGTRPPMLLRNINSIIDSVGVKRSTMLTNFFTVRAFNVSALDHYRAVGITHVGTVPEKLAPAPGISIVHDAKKKKKTKSGQTKAERAQRKLEKQFGGGPVDVLTAGDDNVCDECQEISDEGPYDLDTAEALIPAHPNCRCAFVPADSDVNDAGPDDEPRDEHGRWTITNEKGEKYNVSVIKTDSHWFYHAHDKKGKQAAEAAMISPSARGDKAPYVGQIVVEKPHRGKGLANALYNAIEKHQNIKLVQAPEWRTKAGEALWKKRRKLTGDASYNPDGDPHPITGAGVLVRADNTGRVLFMHHKERDQWEFPAGTVEAGETAQQTAHREMQEETGHSLDFHSMQEHDRSAAHGVDFTTFRADVPLEFKPQLSHEHDDYSWAYPASPPRKLHPGVRQTLLTKTLSDGYDDDEPRDDHGRWTAGGGGGSDATSTTAFKNWFGNSKVVDENGKPQVLFHGTTKDFDTFSTAVGGGVESDFGRGIYFSNSNADINANYAGVGPDLTGRIEREKERILNESEEGDDIVSEEEAEQQARAKLVGHGGAVLPVYLKIEHPFENGGKNETFLDYNHNYNHDTEEYEGEPTGKLVDFIENLRTTAAHNDADPEDAISRIMDEAIDNEGIKASRLEDIVRHNTDLGNAMDPGTGDLSNNEVFRSALEKTGYDGIIDHRVNEKFGTAKPKGFGPGMTGVSATTKHYIVFDPKQIKSATGNKGTFNPKSGRIIDEFNPDEPRDEHGMWTSIGGADFKSFTPPDDWNKVQGQNHSIDEPPLPKLKTWSYKNSKGETVQGKDRIASGVIMREPDGRVWLVKPTNGFGGYKWTFPKGGVEEGMHPQANAIKETFEETGLKARITGWAGDYKGDTGITRMYYAVREGGHPKDKGWETEQVALAHPDDLPHMLNRSRDKKIAEHHLGVQFPVEKPKPAPQQSKFSWGKQHLKFGGLFGKDEFNPDEPRDKLGQWTTSAINMPDLTKISGKEGSNEGGTYVGLNGTKYYIKQPKTADHVTNELLAAKLYKLAGVPTFNYVPVEGGKHVATEKEDLAKKNVSQLSPVERKVAQQDFGVHAWLANWDAAGTGGDNIGVRKNGAVVTLDTGGALKYRAQGEPKGAAFGNEVTETNTLRDPQLNPDAAALYGSMTNSEIVQSINKVTAISNDDIRKVVYRSQLSPEDKEAMVQKLLARKNDLAKQAIKMVAADPHATPYPGFKTTGDLPAPAPKSQTVLGPNTNEKATPPAFKNKMEHAKHLLLKGTTTKEITTTLGWKSMNIPGTAEKLGLKLTKTKVNGVFHYKGEPLNPGEASGYVPGPTPAKTFGKKGVEPAAPAFGSHEMHVALGQLAEKYQEAGTTHGYTVALSKIHVFQAAAKANGVNLEGNAIEGGHAYFYANEAPALTPPPEAAAPIATNNKLDFPHKIASGTEGKALANAIKAVAPSVESYPPETKTATEQGTHSYSVKSEPEFTKMKDLLKNGGYQFEEYNGKDNNGPFYGVKVPLSYTVSNNSAPAAPKYDINTPEGNFAQSLLEHGIPFTTKTLSSGKPVVNVNASHHKEAAEVAKWHPKAELLGSGGGSYIFHGTGGVSSFDTPDVKPSHMAFQKALENAGVFSNISPHNLDENQIQISASTVSKDKMSQIAKSHPQWTLVPGNVATYEAYKDAFSDEIGAHTEAANEASVANAEKAGGGKLTGTVLGPSSATVTPAPVSTAPPTAAELEKAKKNVPLQMQYIPGAKPEITSGVHYTAAQNLITQFNNKYSGKTLTEPKELEQKVFEFKTLTAAVNAHAAAEAPEKAALQKSEQATAAEKMAKLKTSAALAQEAAAKKEAETIANLQNLPEEEQRMYWLKKSVGSVSYHMEVPAAKKAKLEKMGVTPAETGFVRAFTGPASHVNEEMREGFMNDHVFAFKHIMNEALDKFPVFDGNTVWRKISLSAEKIAKYEPGKTVHWPAFSSTSKNPDTWSGNVHFIIHNPKTGRDVQFISENPSESEVIMPADTYYKVLSRTPNMDNHHHKSNGTTLIELEEVVPFGKKKKK